MVIIAKDCNSYKIKSLLSRLNDRQMLSGRFVYLGKQDQDTIDNLKQMGLSKVDQAKFNPVKNAEQFLRNYLDLMGSASRLAQSRKWWATDLSSKNRFTSRLPYLLDQLVRIIKIVNAYPNTLIVILNPEWVIIDSLKRFLNEKGIDFSFIGSRVSRLKEMGFKRTKKILAHIYLALILLRNARYVKRKLGHHIEKIRSSRKSFYIIKSFHYNHSFSEEGLYQDAFFGSLASFLKDKQKLLVFTNIFGDYRACVKRISQCSDPIILPFETFISLADVIRALLESLFGKISLDNPVSFGEFDVTEIINNELYRKRNGIQLYHLLHFWATKELLKTVEVKTFLLTYENNPWEKMCMLAIRAFSPATRIIGYQHNVIPQASTNMFIGLNERDIVPMPDKVLTVGMAPMRILEKYGRFKKGQIEPACALRFEYLFKHTKGKLYTRRKGKIRVLLPLEGIFNVYKMVNYAIQELSGDEKYQVMIRTHPDPILPFSAIEHKLAGDIDTIPNFRISKNRTLTEDIDWADIIMYWGTTVSLEALMHGKPVIHFDVESILSYDPLFECMHLKKTVSNQDALKPVINHYFSLTENEFIEEQTRAKAYLDKYFYPISEEGFKKFIL